MRIPLLRRLLIITGLVIVLVASLLLLLPEVVRRAAINQLEASLATAVRIEDVDVNLFTGQARVSNLVIGGAGGGPQMLQLPAMDFRISRRALLRREIVLTDLVLHRPHLFLERAETGRFSLFEVLRPGEGERGSGPLVTHLTVDRGRITFVDRGTSPRVEVDLRDVRLTVGDLTFTPGSAPGTLQAEARLGNGRIRVTGTLATSPFVSHLMLNGTGIPIDPFRGYLDAGLGALHTRGGRVDGALELHLGSRPEAGLSLRLNGAIEGRELSFGFPDERAVLFSAEHLGIDVPQMEVLPVFGANIAEIGLSGANLRITRDRRGNINLRRLWTSPEPNGPAARSDGAPQAEGVRSRITVRHLRIRESRIEFLDPTVTPPFSGVIADVSAEVRPEPERTDRAVLDFEGRVGESGRVRVSGKVTPFLGPVHMTVEGRLRDYEVALLNPYAEKYIKYRIRRGRVSARGEYAYDDGHLESETDLRFQQFELGEEIDRAFQEEVGIPIAMAVALLEDAKGEVRLKLPVSGNFYSPEFNFDRAVWKAVQNGILKVLTAPLRVLGTILTVGGKIGEVRIDPVAFLPGGAELDPRGSGRVGELAEFLRQRPKLKLELRGRATPQDVGALKQQRLRGRVEEVGGETYGQALARLYRGVSGEESREQPVPLEVMERYLLDRIVVAPEDLATLAEARARAVERSLMERGITPGRLFVVSGEAKAVSETPPGRVEFSLLY